MIDMFYCYFTNILDEISNSKMGLHQHTEGRFKPIPRSEVRHIINIPVEYKTCNILIIWFETVV